MTKQPPSALLRARWLEALLPAVAFDGWTSVAAKAAAKEAGLTANEQALAAPRGIPDLVDAFFDIAETSARAELEAMDLSGLSVREKVAAGLNAWLAALAPNREAARRAMQRGFLPWVAGDAMQRTWSASDMIWTAIGDTSEDYNKYSKRGLLAAIIPIIFLKWLDEPDQDDLNAYIAERLTQAMRAGQAGGRIAGPLLSAIGRVWSARRP
ncbi:MAG: COQ9 family protein [Pseudomonadota bacterium]